MSRYVNSIAGRLSLRDPQRHSLEILDRVMEIAPARKSADIENALKVIESEYGTVTDFEREFPSLCFALATGVGKTRLMGAFVSYLHLAHGMNNFFVLAPNLTIYNKLIADFTPNTPKYVFKGISEFSIAPPVITTGENYERHLASGGQLFPVTINIFNISKIASEARGGRALKMRSFKEELGESYFDYLAGLEDLVLLMDESHRYRASAGLRAINELKPILGLELTATPFVETPRGPVPFKNVIFDYPLSKAMADGYVKEPAVVTRKDFNPKGMSPEELEELKLSDGIRLHESVKVELETYARETENKIVKPFVLVIARDTTHAGELLKLIQSERFFEGRYKDKVIQVDSSQTGAAEDEMIQRLLSVESTEEPTEIVIHVNMLKEGWDVTNLYTIVPLRAANARILIEQSIGRGLRLPYGKRTGVPAVDRLNIVAHDKFQEIVDEANKPDSAIRLQQVILAPDELEKKSITVVSQSQLSSKLGFVPTQKTSATHVAENTPGPEFQTAEEQKVAQITYKVIQKLGRNPKVLPSVSYLQNDNVREMVLREVASEYQHQPKQMELEGIASKPLDIEEVVKKTSSLVAQQTIDIPRILVVPKGEVKAHYKPFTLELSSMNYPAPSEELWVQYLRTGGQEILGLGRGGVQEERLENYIVGGLIDFDDISYDDNADLLYDLAGQVVTHLRSYLEDVDIHKVLQFYQRDIAKFIRSQMLKHYIEDDVEYEVVISSGFSPLKDSAYSANALESMLDYKAPPKDKSNMARYLFGGFQKCLYPAQKFHSDTERQLAVIVEREALKWFRPAKGQFQIYYRTGMGEQEYQPDFVAETAECIYMLEPKMRRDMESPDVLAKKEAAVNWCKHASEYAETYGGKPWIYVLIPHDVIAENMTLDGLSKIGG